MSSSRKVAEDFIKDQLRIMREYGKEPKLSMKRYQEAVTETQKSFESLRPEPKARAKAASRKST